MSDDDTRPAEVIVDQCFICGDGPTWVISDYRTEAHLGCFSCGNEFLVRR